MDVITVILAEDHAVVREGWIRPEEEV